MLKDLGSFPHQSAHGKGTSLVCGINAHFLILHCHISKMWIDHFICSQESSRCPDSLKRSMGLDSKLKIHTYLTGGRVSFLHDGISISPRIWCSLNADPATFEIIVLFKVKVGANYQVFTCLRSFHIPLEVNRKVWNNRTGYFNHANRSRDCKFGAVQNWQRERKS